MRLAVAREHFSPRQPRGHPVDEVSHRGTAVWVNPDVLTSPLVPPDLVLFHVCARSPALVSAPGLPELDQCRLVAQAGCERILKAWVTEVSVGQLQKEHESRLHLYSTIEATRPADTAMLTECASLTRHLPLVQPYTRSAVWHDSAFSSPQEHRASENAKVNSADEIWNRAVMQGGGPAPRSGDVALAAALRLHSLAMSGGLVDAVGRLRAAELDAAESGYRWLGLDPAARVVAIVRSEIGDGALDDDDRAESLEQRADEAYAQAIPTDQAVVDAFQARFSDDPQAFASP
jgi:hypothetical protein